MRTSARKSQPGQAKTCPRAHIRLACASFLFLFPIAALATTPADGIKVDEIKVDWNKVEQVSKTTPTLQVVVNPMLRRGSPIHDQSFQALKNLQADYVRFVPWYPYPKLGVAELEPPTADRTSWDFSLIDPLVLDFLDATAGHSVVLNFSTIPQWMFKTDQPVAYPADANEVSWSYEQGTEFRDASLKEVSDYYARLVSWYTLGGFTDEIGRRHDSGHHFKVDYLEVLNEPEYEHAISPQTYARVYDAVVAAVLKVNPQMKFLGMSLATPSRSPEFFEYFLDPKNHQPGIPLDAISYHFYAVPSADQTLDIHPYTFFEQADHFIDTVRYVESIRRRLSPQTITMLNEVGSIRSDDIGPASPDAAGIPASYWSLSAAVYAYVYAQLAHLGIEVIGESQLVGYPTQFPSVTMIDWSTGQPNARYWVLSLLREHFGPGDKLMATSLGTPSLYAQAFVTHGGKRTILVVNRRNHTATFSLAGSAGAHIQVVDASTALGPPSSADLKTDEVTLSGLAVAVITFGP